MKNIIYQFLLIRKGERRALLILLSVLIIVATVRVVMPNVSFSNSENDNEAFVLAMNKLQEKIKQEKTKIKPVSQKIRIVSEPPVKRMVKPFVFDPNKVSMDALIKMNLPEFVARNIVAYREAGAVYRKPDDLRRIYGLEKGDFDKILPYIQITLQEEKNEELSPDASEDTNSDDKRFASQLDINVSDSIELQLIPGIGPSYASRIVKYRTMLGGYYDFEQLWEVYGMDSIRFCAIKEYCSLDTLQISKLDLRKASFRDLIKHPYIDRKTTYALVQFRDFTDSICQLEELLSNQIFDYKILKKIKPYVQLK